MGTPRTGSGMEATAACVVSRGWMCASDLARGRAPQAASRKPAASPGANATTRMQEYFVSVCFMTRTALPCFIAVYGGKRNEIPRRDLRHFPELTKARDGWRVPRFRARAVRG